jgi:hypothetical protein
VIRRWWGRCQRNYEFLSKHRGPGLLVRGTDGLTGLGVDVAYGMELVCRVEHGWLEALAFWVMAWTITGAP